jgi:hypothetical protein
MAMRIFKILIVGQGQWYEGLDVDSLRQLLPDEEIFVSPDLDSIYELLRQSKFDFFIVDLIFLSRNFEKLTSVLNDLTHHPILIILNQNGREIREMKERFPHQIYFSAPDPKLLFDVISSHFFDRKTNLRQTLSMPEEVFSEIIKVLDQLLFETGARCILLSDTNGRLIAKSGEIDLLPIEAIISLLGGGIATLTEAGRIVDDDAVVNLTYREGSKSDLYAVDLLQNMLLILVIDHGFAYSRLGTVWFYARQSVIKVNNLLANVKFTQPFQNVSESLDQMISNEIDRLFIPPDNQ